MIVSLLNNSFYKLMKKILPILMTTIISSSLAMAQKKAEEEKLATAVEQLRIAMVDGDRSMLQYLAAEELSYGHSGGHVEDKTAFIEKLVSGKSDFVSIELSNQTIEVLENSAVVRHNLYAITNDNGIPGEVRLHVMSVWQKQQNAWKMVARQAVKIAK
jgi:hypothetical protein